MTTPPDDTIYWYKDPGAGWSLTTDEDWILNGAIRRHGMTVYKVTGESVEKVEGEIQ
jgi:hypothetical protein